MKKKFFVPLCLLVAMASCNKSVLEETTVVPGANEIATNNEVLSWGETVYLPSGKIWTNKFADDFADFSNWTSENRNINAGGLANPALKTWYQRSDMVSVSNGKLLLSSKKISSSELKCAAVTTEGKYTAKYGYFVAKMLLQNPLDIGSQSSFWMGYRDPRPYGGADDAGGADGAEIDIFESSWINDNMQSTVHIDWFSSPYIHTSKGIGGLWAATGSTSGYHQYGLWWNNAKIEIYFDGALKRSLTDTYYIPVVNEFMKLSTGAAWGTANVNFDNAALNTQRTTYIDWVRVYQ